MHTVGCARTPEDVLANLEVARSTGMDFLAQVGYWDESSIDAVVAALPEDFPVLIAEWTGSEGSDWGPIGSCTRIASPSSRSRHSSW